MICPDYYGCSGKLSFGETQRLASLNTPQDGGGDFSQLVTTGIIISSIDRVHRCAKDWDRFARIAINHAFGDVLCAGATPVQAMISFEFGIDAPNDEHIACSGAFARELARRSVLLGKCHSARTDGTTAVTISTLAARPSRLKPRLQQGKIYLSRPIGALKAQYLSELGVVIDQVDALRVLEWPENEAFHSASWELLTDISGHGLLGALSQVAQNYLIEVNFGLSAIHAFSPEVLSWPVECLQNPLDSYNFPFDIDPSAEVLATLRETAGPFLGFIEDESVHSDVAAKLGKPIGQYHQGKCGVKISWTR